ncbi:MAG TPA: hypothetical protein VHB98_23760 [Chloroflexota bacterium]|nr:hypothetical protein [Chloroflexota bacterium]
MNYHIQRAVEEYVDRQSWQIDRVQQAVAQARAGQGKPLEHYVARSIADGTITRAGYEHALAIELVEAQAEGI